MAESFGVYETLIKNELCIMAYHFIYECYIYRSNRLCVGYMQWLRHGFMQTSEPTL